MIRTILAAALLSASAALAQGYPAKPLRLIVPLVPAHSTQALVDVMGGQVAMMFDQVSASAAHVGSGFVAPAGTPREAGIKAQ